MASSSYPGQGESEHAISQSVFDKFKTELESAGLKRDMMVNRVWLWSVPETVEAVQHLPESVIEQLRAAGAGTVRHEGADNAAGGKQAVKNGFQEKYLAKMEAALEEGEISAHQFRLVAWNMARFFRDLALGKIEVSGQILGVMDQDLPLDLLTEAANRAGGLISLENAMKLPTEAGVAPTIGMKPFVDAVEGSLLASFVDWLSTDGSSGEDAANEDVVSYSTEGAALPVLSSIVVVCAGRHKAGDGRAKKSKKAA